jgi:YVTN family beta-propeller protein/VCBS repeat-containing protein
MAISTGQVVASAVTAVPSNAAAVTVTPPVISSVTLGTPNSSTGAVVVTVKATDPGKYALTYKAATSTKGTVSITTAGIFTYKPTATARHAAAKPGAGTAVTTDTVTVTVTNSKGAVTTQAVTVTITPANTAPVPKTPTVGTPNATTGVVTGSVSATDANSDALTYSGSTTTAKGTVTVTNAGAFTYTPTSIARHGAAKNGATTAEKTDTFSVTVTDGYGGSVAVPVKVTISPSNTVPTGMVTVAKPNPVTGVATGKLTATDTDADVVTYTASNPASGAVVVNADGSFVYTPTAAARTSARSSATAKTDSFTITINDGYGGTRAITVTPTIAPSNTAPVAGTPTSTTNTDTGVVTGAVNATDAEKDALAYTAGTVATAKASVTVTAAGAFTYTPDPLFRHAAARDGAIAGDKIDMFTVTVTDKYGAAATIPVSVTISPTNAKPVAGAPVVGTPNIKTGVVTGTASATDANGDPLTYSGSTTTSQGTVIVASNGSFTYTPTDAARQQAGANPTDVFTVTVNDGYGGIQTLNITVAVEPAPGVTVATVQIGGGPSQLALSPDGRRLYVTSSNNHSVSIIDTATNSWIGFANVDAGPVGLTVTRDGTVYTANITGRTLSVFNSGSSTDSFVTLVAKSIAPSDWGTGANAVAVSPDGRYVYATYPQPYGGSYALTYGGLLEVYQDVSNTGKFSNIDGFTLRDDRFSSKRYTALPQALIYASTSRGDRIYVVATSQNPDGYGSLWVFEPIIGPKTNSYGEPLGVGHSLRLEAAIQVGTAGNYPVALALSPDNQRVYVANSTDGTISVISTETNTVTGIFSAGPGLRGQQSPDGLVVSPDGTRLYVANGGTNTVAVINTSTYAITDTITVGNAPRGIALSADGHRLYVANSVGDTLSVVAV